MGAIPGPFSFAYRLGAIFIFMALKKDPGSGKEPNVCDLVYFSVNAWGSKEKIHEDKLFPLERILSMLQLPAGDKLHPVGIIVNCEIEKDVFWCNVFIFTTKDLWWFPRHHLGVSSD